jgi:hypothetical protein
LLENIGTHLSTGIKRLEQWWNSAAKVANRVASIEDLALLDTYRPNRAQRRAARYAGRIRCDVNRKTRGARRTRLLGV